MGRPAAHKSVVGQAPNNGYVKWLPRWSTQGFVGYRHNQWYAIAPEFCLAGMGQTPDEAKHDLMALVNSYLHSVYANGRSFDDARRPIGTVATLRMLLPLSRRRRLTLFPSPAD